MLNIIMYFALAVLIISAALIFRNTGYGFTIDEIKHLYTIFIISAMVMAVCGLIKESSPITKEYAVTYIESEKYYVAEEKGEKFIITFATQNGEEKEYKQYTVDKITIKENETPQAYIKIITKKGFSTKVYAEIYVPKNIEGE